MLSKILLPTDETTEDRRASADRRSPPPPATRDLDHCPDDLSVLDAAGGGRQTRAALAEPRTDSEVRAEAE